jgi:hypothetical protein
LSILSCQAWTTGSAIDVANENDHVLVEFEQCHRGLLLQTGASVLCHICVSSEESAAGKTTQLVFWRDMSGMVVQNEF